MTERGTTIFLTSSRLEIVERLCGHVAIIHKGRLVAQGSLDELRAGVQMRKEVKPRSTDLPFDRRPRRRISPQLEELSWLMLTRSTRHCRTNSPDPDSPLANLRNSLRKKNNRLD